MNDTLINRSPETWRLVFQKIQPTVAAGNAAYEAAVYAGQSNRMVNTTVLQAYQDHLLRAGKVLTKEQLSDCVKWALELNLSLDSVLDHPALPHVLAQPEAFRALLSPPDRVLKPIFTKEVIKQMYADKVSIQQALRDGTPLPEHIKTFSFRPES